VKDLESLDKLVAGMIDRFGPMPAEVDQLVNIVKMRWEACQLGFEKLTIKKETLKGYIPSVNNESFFQSETFSRILQYVQQHPRRSRLKEAKDKLIVIVENIPTLEAAKAIFEDMKA
jgi:transcription-repair coupling factor (superfamily II helicase)